MTQHTKNGLQVNSRNLRPSETAKYPYKMENLKAILLDIRGCHEHKSIIFCDIRICIWNLQTSTNIRNFASTLMTKHFSRLQHITCHSHGQPITTFFFTTNFLIGGQMVSGETSTLNVGLRYKFFSSKLRSAPAQPYNHLPWHI